MSQENVELVRRGLEIFEAEGLDAWLEQFVVPDAVLVQAASVAAPEAGTWSGWDGWRKAVVPWMDEFEDWKVDFLRLLDAGDDRVVVTWRDRGRGRRSGIIVERPESAFVHTLRDGRIVHTVQYGVADEALEAVGLREGS
jgi:ketosteroid isomerase-like protein